MAILATLRETQTQHALNVERLLRELQGKQSSRLVVPFVMVASACLHASLERRSDEEITMKINGIVLARLRLTERPMSTTWLFVFPAKL